MRAQQMFQKMIHPQYCVLAHILLKIKDISFSKG